jgi:anaerobic magnesium-protoporphyrin IX monomethyl ester cyclase
MRVYLLNPPFLPNFGRGARWQEIGRAGTLYYPIWLAYAAANISRNHEIKLVDAIAKKWKKDDLIKDIKEYSPEIIIIDSSFPSLNNDINITNFIKQEYDCAKIVLVGPPASQYHEEIIKNQGVDFVVRFEYDFILSELLFSLEKGIDPSSINGITFKNQGSIISTPNREFSSSEELDEIPFVSKIYKQFLNINDYFLGQSLYPEIQIFTGRGCPNHCIFCSWPHTLMGRKYRVRSIKNLLDEIEWIHENLDVKEIFFEDDTFTLDKGRVLEFCEGYIQRGFSIPWSCNARVNTLDLEIMKLMKKSNCRLLIAGYESGVDTILQAAKKGISTEEIKKFAHNAKKAKLLVHGDIIVGLPGETKETVAMTKKMIWEIKPDILQVSVASPFPGTEFYNWCTKENFLLTNNLDEYLDKDGHQNTIISYPELSSQEMVTLADDILKSYYLSLQYIPITLSQIFRKNGIGELRRICFSAKMFISYIYARVWN